MSHSQDDQRPALGEVFKTNEVVRDYDATVGSATKRIAQYILEKHLQTDSLEDKVVLDNACGTVVVTREILFRTDNVKIEATDISEPMIAALELSLESSPNAKMVTAAVMDGQVVVPVVWY